MGKDGGMGEFVGESNGWSMRQLTGLHFTLAPGAAREVAVSPMTMPENAA